MYQKEKEIAIAAVRQASRLCEKVRAAIPPALAKEDKSPVTVADFGSQAIICKAIREAFPDDPIVAEECAQQLRQPGATEILSQVTRYVQEIIPSATADEVLDWIDYGNGTVGERFWTLDPIDGTKGFLRQDQYAIALALIEGGEVKLGILGCPALWDGTLFVAVRDEGSYRMPLTGEEAVRLQVVDSQTGEYFRLVESVESSHGDSERQNAIARAVGITNPSLKVDSQAKYGIVASGRAALYLRLPSPKYPDYRENIWDHAAGAIIVEQAGGIVTDMFGKPLDFFSSPKMINNRGIVASCGSIHQAVLKALSSQ
ncbi:MAG: 3'(2'),5'-bisphosphate nucleotidase [Geminocystis sp.]|nr:3'(2'),5'-bisphosphate nucleotidase [Geminocystis sp.]HIK38413.1 3'(2'),5'-bisphosphate nucleotidase [Geminocystis sp. M7585_C2015_104]MCS7147758.1 3'(2'),5'-bisphosphate nucleotidase [Geminocystis sp.]MCX8079222.1 3'(2'),5'-bisphosphate nucleotidase [Geminocystis sp.]MDW8116668.1 3'(2'),5'-bisphosphate nucleotidase [Geminocystis sp.]